MRVLAWVVVAGLVLVGCEQAVPRKGAQPRLKQALAGLSEEAVSYAPLSVLDLAEPVALISEQTLLDLSAAAQPSSLTHRETAAVLTSALAHQKTLGVQGALVTGPLTGGVFIVARDWDFGPSGDIEVRDVYVVTAALAGEAEYVPAPSLALSVEAFPGLACGGAGRGCQPVLLDGNGHSATQVRASFEYSGLPRSVIHNLESGPAEANASGYSPVLRVVGSQGVSNDFSCQGQVLPSRCADCNTEWPEGDCASPTPNLYLLNKYLPLSEESEAVVLREQDYLALVGTQGFQRPDERFFREASVLTSLANDGLAAGVSATPETDASFSAQFVIVARNLAEVVTGPGVVKLEATEWYIALHPLSGTAPVVGTLPQLVLRQSEPALEALRTECGAVTIPEAAPNCSTPQCLPADQFQSMTPHYGTARWTSGEARVSMRAPASSGASSLVTYTCREFPRAMAQNLFNTAWEAQPLAVQFAIVPRSAYEHAKQLANPSTLFVSTDLTGMAARAASVANDVWTEGAYSAPLQQSAQSFGAQDILIVANDPVLTEDGRVLTKDFFIAAMGLSGSTPWIGRGIELAFRPNALGGGGRCCGPSLSGQQETPDLEFEQPPGCNPSTNANVALCADGAVLAKYSTPNQADTRASFGKPAIKLVRLGSNGREYVISMDAPLGGVGSYGCGNVRPECDSERPMGNLPFASWEAEVPRGRPGCAPNSTISGREVPPSCTIAGSSSWGLGAGGSLTVVRPGGGAVPPSECDGRCPDCSSPLNATNTDVVPKQCFLSRSAGDDICGFNSGTLVSTLQQGLHDILVAQTGQPCGDLRDPEAICGGCTALTGSLKTFGASVCTRCTRPSDNAPFGSCTTYGTRFGETVTPNLTPFHIAGGDPGPPRESSLGAPGPTYATAETGLLPTTPCNSPSCTRTGGATRLPSTAPRPGGAAETKDGPLTGINGATTAANSSGDAIADDEKKAAAVKADAKGDPVNLFDGALTLSQQDLSFPGPHRDLTFTRYYNSRTNTRSALGSNWVHSWDVRLIPLKQENMPAWLDPYCAGTPLETTCVMLVSGDSSRIFYKDLITGLFMPQAGSMATVLQAADGWVVREPDGHQLTFDERGSLRRDVDRFGNGFTLEYEPTPEGLLFDAICPALAYTLLNGGYQPVVGPSGISMQHAGCVLLSGLTGLGDMPVWSQTSNLTAAQLLPLPPSPSAALSDAQQLVFARQAGGFGLPMPFGPRHKLLKKVRDDLGRELLFSYRADGLLQKVEGPAGTKVEFTYATPTTQPGGLNEQFLATAERDDGATGTPAIEATGRRGYSFEYAWQRAGEQMPSDLPAARAAYLAYFRNTYECGFFTKDACGKMYESGVLFQDITRLLDEQERTLYSHAADNITTVQVRGTDGTYRIESETRYASNAYHPNFDKALAQRWGATPDVALPSLSPAPSPGPWAWQDTTLPLATFEYQGAQPVSNSSGQITGDIASSFLPPTLATRYGFESPDTTAQQNTYDKGLLLPPNAPEGDRPGLPSLAVGQEQTLADGTRRPACGIHRLPELRTRLPGYKPSVDYFDATLPTANLATPGVAWDTQLKRTVLSCETLALAETYDVRHNDLASTWKKAQAGDYVFETMTGRRKHTAANANRICNWVRYTDRDGDVHVTGLNFQGRRLVEAVRVVEGASESWKVAETLYNADGNVLSQRRTTSGAAPWAEANGDTRYSYLEEPIAAGSIGTVRPMHWAKRGNVIEVLTRPRGGSVTDESETGGAADASKGRFARYGYEPFFNQVRLVEVGSVSSTGARTVNARTSLIFDFQELNDTTPAFVSLLDRLQQFGAQLKMVDPPQPGGPRYDWQYISANQLFLTLHGQDVNGDGVTADPRGVPVRVTQEGLGSTRENTFITWAPSGKPATIRAPDESLTLFEYYNLSDGPTGQSGAVQGTNTGNGGYAGFLARVTRSRATWPATAGPGRVGCEELGAYRFLISSCGTDLSQQLVGLGLTPAAAAGVLGSKSASTSIDYNLLGHVSASRSFSGEVTTFITDTDGRESRVTLNAANGTTAHSYVLVTRDAFMRARQTRRFSASGDVLGETLRTFDTEDKVLTECRAAEANGCGPGQEANETTRWVYTREGHVFQEIDGEGLTQEFTRDARKWVTKEQLKSSVPAEGSRQIRTTWDDDGNATARIFGTTPSLTETRVFDGLNRLKQHITTAGVTWNYGYSGRDVLLSKKHGATAVPWEELYSYDAMGRLAVAKRNGTVTAQYTRLPGGLVYAVSGDGRATHYATTDALGRTVYSEDGAGNLSVATDKAASASSARVVTEWTLRKRPTDFFTTGSEATMDVLGLPVILREVGGSLQRTTRLDRDASGNLLTLTTADTAETQGTYDWLGRLKQLRQQRAFGGADFDVSDYTYNRRGQLSSMLEPAAPGATRQVTTQLYTGFGEPREKTEASSQVSSWTYDGLGRKVRHAVGGVVDLGYKYDAATGRLSAIVRGEPSSSASPVLQSFMYDALGRMTQGTHFNLALSATASTPTRVVTTTRTYEDALRRFTEETQVGQHPARAVTSQWGLLASNRWRRSVTLPGRTMREDFDGDGREVSLTRQSGHATSLSWLGELLTDTESLRPGTTPAVHRAVSFDALAQPTSWDFTHQTSGAAALHVEVVRDVMGRVSSSSQAFSAPSGLKTNWRGYVFDAMGRLSVLRESVTSPGASPTPHQTTSAMGTAVESAGNTVSAARWAYTREAAVGSVLSISRTDVTLTAPRFSAPARGTGHRLNSFQLDGQPSRTVTHDDAGRVSSDGALSLAYDDFGALARAGTEDFLYDVSGRLAARVTPTESEVLVSDGAQFVQAYDAAGIVRWTATWGPGIDSLLSVEKGSQEYFALDDGKGSVVGWLQAGSNQLVSRAEFTPEGRGKFVDETTQTSCEESGNTLCGNHLSIPFGFHSAYRAQASGLLYFRNRWYSTQTQQWLSKDPLGAVDSFDLYAFNRFDSVNFFDPLGLQGQSATTQGEPAPNACKDRDCSEIVEGEWGLDLSDGPKGPCVACGDRSLDVARVFVQNFSAKKAWNELSTTTQKYWTNPQPYSPGHRVGQAVIGGLFGTVSGTTSALLPAGVPVPDLSPGQESARTMAFASFWATHIVAARNGAKQMASLPRPPPPSTATAAAASVPSVAVPVAVVPAVVQAVKPASPNQPSKGGDTNDSSKPQTNTEQSGTPPPNKSPPGAGRTGAFAEAKRQNGIPASQQPSRTGPNLDKRGNEQPGRSYEFEIPKEGGGTKTVIIRDDAAGHNFGPGDPQNRGPHFNDPAGNHYDY
jgi:RHS repeat-associated protein